MLLGSILKTVFLFFWCSLSGTSIKRFKIKRDSIFFRLNFLEHLHTFPLSVTFYSNFHINQFLKLVKFALVKSNQFQPVSVLVLTLVARFFVKKSCFLTVRLFTNWSGKVIIFSSAHVREFVLCPTLLKAS